MPVANKMARIAGANKWRELLLARMSVAITALGNPKGSVQPLDKIAQYGRIGPKGVAAFPRNGWADSSETGGRFAPKYPVQGTVNIHHQGSKTPRKACFLRPTKSKSQFLEVPFNKMSGFSRLKNI